MGISSQKELYKTIIGLTHNQVVPGSSPGGTTLEYSKVFIYSNVGKDFFHSCRQCWYLLLFV